MVQIVTPNVVRIVPPPSDDSALPPIPRDCDLKIQFPESDSGNVDRFIVDYHGRVAYCHAWRRWFIRDEFGVNRPDEKNEILLMATRTVNAITYEVPYVHGAEAQRRRLKHAQRSQDAPRIRALVDLASAQPGIARLPEDFDADPNLAGAENGILDLRTGALLTASPEQLVTKRVGAPWDPDAECPVFEKFLMDACRNDPHLFDFINRLIGYCLTGLTVEQIVVILWGVGGTGKTTLLEIVLSLLGDYGSRVSSETFLLRSADFGGGIPNDVAALAGTRMVVATELEQGRHLAEARVKELTGSDRVSARFMRGEWFTYSPTFKIWLCGNHVPRVRGGDTGIWRRIRLIEFNAAIEEANIDRRLPEKLLTELPGILRWAVDGARRWYDSGLIVPDGIKDASALYRESEDLLGQFVAERCVVEAGAHETLKELTAQFNQWAEMNNERRVSSKGMGSMLDERGFARARGTGNVVFVHGLRLAAGY